VSTFGKSWDGQAAEVAESTESIVTLGFEMLERELSQ
jgi:hypothetical protein